MFWWLSFVVIFLHSIQALDLNLGELDLTSQDEFILDEVNG